MIRDIFHQILDNYLIERIEFNAILNERKEKKRNGELSPDSIASQKSYKTPSLLRDVLPNEIKLKANLNDSYKVKGSAGNGYMPEVPHICIYDTKITTTAQKGYYIVYLFDVKSKKVFLSLMQGFTEYQNRFGNISGRIKAREYAVKAQKHLRSIFNFELSELEMLATGDLAEGYKKGNICNKVYEYNAFPTDIELLDDLRNLIGIYRELKGLIGESIFGIEDNVTESEYQQNIQGRKGKVPNSGPVKKKDPKTLNNQTNKYNRDAEISAQALINANYQCENNIDHFTFISKFGHQFVEAHHLIPLEFENKFDYSLDVPENIVSLCPNCHRAFHHSDGPTKHQLIDKFLKIRYSGLQERGIAIAPAEIKSLYKLVENIEEFV